MDLTAIITSIIQAIIPPEYLPVVVAIMTIWLAFEQYLAKTKRFKANSTLQALTNIAKSVKIKLGGLALFLIAATIIFTGCASVQQSWDKLTPDQQARIVADGMQKQLETLFDTGKAYVSAKPEYQDKWRKQIVPAFDVANKTLRASMELIRISKCSTSDLVDKVGPAIGTITAYLADIGAIAPQGVR